MNKNYQIQFTSKAKSDYYSILEYSLEISFNYYKEIMKNFKSKIQNLLKYPYIYPIIPSKKDLRKIVINNNYILVYKIINNTIIIQRIFSKKVNYTKYI